MIGLFVGVLLPAGFVAAATDGVETSGVVCTKVRFNGSAARRRFLRYEDASGLTHTHRSLVSAELWAAVEEGGAIPAVCSASDPSVSAPRHLVDAARQATPAQA